MALTKDRFLSFAQVAELIGLKVGTLRNGEGGTADIPRMKIGGRVLFSERAVQQWMARKAREAEEKRANVRNLLDERLNARRRREAQRAVLSLVKGRRTA